MRSLLRPLTGNWQLKLLALALAVLLWVVVSAEQVTSQWIIIPLQIRENDPNYALIPADVPDDVEVRFTGSGRDLLDVSIRKPPLILTIDEIDGTTQEFRLTPSMVLIPSQLFVNAQDVRGALLSLNFRRLATRTLTVRAAVNLQIPDDWALVDTLRILPRQVELRGPAERVETVDQVRTEPFTLPASDSVFSTIVALDTSNLRGLELSVNQVRISGRVDRVVQRRLVDVVISVGDGVRVQPREVDVVITGPRSVVETVRSSDFRVVIAIGAIPEFIPAEGLSVPLRVEQLRSGVRASVAPPAVRLLPVGAGEDTATVSSTATDTTVAAGQD